MTRDEQEAILAIALISAFADGRKHDREREEIRAIVDALAGAGEPNLPALYQRVLTGRETVDAAAARLTDPRMRQLAYEMAVGVCDADGARDDAERRFLADLQRRLGLDVGSAEAIAEQADALADAPLARPLPAALEAPIAAAPAGGAGSAAAVGTGTATTTVAGSARASSMTEPELDALVQNAAIVNGALELLPESLATMAIIPLQMKMVYRIGAAYGYPLDAGHAREFIATVGVGLTSQYLEQTARKLVGGLLRGVGGGLLGGLGRQATSSAMSFATTWALGQVARRYYAGGRTLDAAALKDAFAGLLVEAKSLQSQYLPQIQARAKTLDVQQVLRAVRA
jgi:uncharacterized protein (DUF697 family)/tellurite resistance protein